VLDELLGRFAFVSDHAADRLDLARDQVAALDLDQPHGALGLRVLHVLGVLSGADLFRRSFGDMDRAADSERAACRDSGQFRQGHTYRHERSLSFDG
jgi:hypothetical protein